MCLRAADCARCLTLLPPAETGGGGYTGGGERPPAAALQLDASGNLAELAGVGGGLGGGGLSTGAALSAGGGFSAGGGLPSGTFYSPSASAPGISAPMCWSSGADDGGGGGSPPPLTRIPSRVQEVAKEGVLCDLPPLPPEGAAAVRELGGVGGGGAPPFDDGNELRRVVDRYFGQLGKNNPKMRTPCYPLSHCYPSAPCPFPPVEPTPIAPQDPTPTLPPPHTHTCTSPPPQRPPLIMGFSKSTWASGPSPV